MGSRGSASPSSVVAACRSVPRRRSVVTLPSCSEITVSGDSPTKEYRPTCTPRSTLSSRKTAPSGCSFRKTETGVSRSAGIRTRSGMRGPWSAVSRYLALLGDIIGFS